MDALEEVTIEKMGIYNSALFLSLDAQNKNCNETSIGAKKWSKGTGWSLEGQL